jgi:hypothetical protein
MKATITSKEVPIAESTEKKTEPFRSAARRFSRGTSALRYALASSSQFLQPIDDAIQPLVQHQDKRCDRPNMKAGAATWAITSES